MKKTMTKIFALVLVLAMVIGFVAMIPTQATANVEILANNVGFAEKLHMMYAIDASSIADYNEVVINLSDEDGNSLGDATRTGTQTVSGVECAVFTAQQGIAVQDIAENVYAQVVADGNVVAEGRRSVLEYLYSQLLTNESVTANQKAMYESLLAYAGALQTILMNQSTPVDCKDINNYSFVKVENGTIDGTYTAGMIEAGTTLSGLTCDQVAGEGQKIVWTVVKSGAASGTYAMSTEEVQAITVEKGVNLIMTAEVVEDTSDLPTKTVTFTMGADGTASHSDGSETATYSETVDGYTLSLTSGSKMYQNALDAQGNGGIKYGTSSVAGTFTLTVADDVSKVIIYVAGYKANVAKVSINGGEAQEITTLSNNGEYTAIEIDTSSNKTINFTTVSGGYRAMLNTIEFVVPDDGQTESTEPSTEATEPSTEATEPSTEATEPSTEATEPSTEATEPSTEATEPSGEVTLVEKTNTYTFSNYTAGTQYAENEEHVLDDYTTVTTTQCHFTTQLRIYSSSTHDGYAIIKSTGVLSSITVNAGNKVDTLNVYGSTDGVTWVSIGDISVTSTSYADYTLSIDKEAGYKFLKLDVAGSSQVRIANMTLTSWVPEE